MCGGFSFLDFLNMEKIDVFLQPLCADTIGSTSGIEEIGSGRVCGDD